MTVLIYKPAMKEQTQNSSSPNVKSSVLWSAVERFSVQGVSFLLTLLITRLVTPAEFGLIGMLSVFIAIAQTFIDSGFGNALIQKKNRSAEDYSTMFYFNLVVALVFYIILYICAPLIASFYREPQLTNITRIVGLNLIISSLSLVQNTHLTIKLNFKLLSKISLTSTIISGITGIILAYRGYGVWALVVQSLLLTSLTTSLLWISTKWHPNMTFSRQSFDSLFAFGSKLLCSGLIHTIYMNLYTLVIGRFYNPSDVGYFNRASSISLYPSINIVNIISRAVFPVQCAHQDDDSWLETSFNAYLRMSCYIVFPLMLLLAVLAKPLVYVILTKQWMPAVPLIIILSIAHMIEPILRINGQMLNVRGRSDLFLKAEIIKKIVAVVILISTIPFGLYWLCIGLLIYNFCDAIIIILFVKKVLNTGLGKQFRSVFPIFLLSLIPALLSWLSMQLPLDNYIRSYNLVCIINIIVGGVAYTSTFLVISRLTKVIELNIIVNFIKKTFKH